MRLQSGSVRRKPRAPTPAMMSNILSLSSRLLRLREISCNQSYKVTTRHQEKQSYNKSLILHHNYFFYHQEIEYKHSNYSLTWIRTHKRERKFKPFAHFTYIQCMYIYVIIHNITSFIFCSLCRANRSGEWSMCSSLVCRRISSMKER